MYHRKYDTEEERIKAKRLSLTKAKKKYRLSQKGIEKESKYESSTRGKEVRKGINHRFISKPGMKEILAPYKKKNNLKYKYGITIEDYNRMCASQNNVCVICGGVNENGRALHVDHNHTTGKVRELICGRCNVVIGYAKEDPGIMIKMAEYIRKHQGVPSGFTDGDGI